MRLAAFLFALLLPVSAMAATTPTPPSLDQLFGQLKRAGSTDEAKPIEEKIGGIFLQSGSPSIDLLMTRAQAAVTAGDNDTAKQLLEAVTGLAPDYAEGWHLRANLQRTMKDDAGAMASLEHVIILNPRQFAALYELGNMLEDYGNKAGALKLYRKALELDPQLDGAQKHIDALTRSVNGQEI
ncbi:MAG: tetratricopeptide repeat protein [Alphaproteobacteria bacterium]|nr:tetratricopeptide repeat protein [Alphaproteobacteria bacterium]MBL6936928.1 tetratricopeptide repeat protein [Alphaproteobacteria bacterium]MBL7097697.1 tetratricopeptide repeat protein [Alphaproteobacteria bacterium]